MPRSYVSLLRVVEKGETQAMDNATFLIYRVRPLHINAMGVRINVKVPV